MDFIRKDGRIDIDTETENSNKSTRWCKENCESCYT